MHRRFRPLPFASLGFFSLPLACVPSANNRVEPAMALTRLHPYESRRAAGTKTLGPGESAVLADLAGPGIVTNLHLSIDAPEPGAPRLLVLRAWWDGTETPCIESPVWDFFLSGHGAWRDAESSPIASAAGGRALDCRLPMPFYRSGRIAVANEGEQSASLTWSIDWQKHRTLQSDMPLFHAQYRQETPAAKGRDCLVLEARGRGHYLGCHLSLSVPGETAWSSGRERIWIDDADRPSIEGTGIAGDFLLGPSPAPGSRPFHGAPVVEPGRAAFYRLRLLDPVPYTKSIRAAFTPPPDRETSYASVAYWYQGEPHENAGRMPSAKGRMW